MSAISKLPFQLRNLLKDVEIPSVTYSGWQPPPKTQVESNNVSSVNNLQSSISTPLVVDEIHHHQKQSTWNYGKSYFEKLQSVAQNRLNDEIKSYLSTSPENHLDDALENLIESIQPRNTWNSNNIKDNQSRADILLSQFELLKQIYINNGMNKSIQKEKFDTYTFPIITPDGNVLFDFSKQSITYDIYIQLMQLVRLSNLDKFIQKIFHKSGEYHHIDYKEKRRNQLAKDQENVSDHFIDRFYQNPTVNCLNSDSSKIDKMNCYITMAKAVHFRTSSHCFVLDGIDISSRFQHDRNILRDTCFRFHNYINTDSNTKQKENKNSPYDASLSDCTGRSAMLQLTTQFILVLCTHRMREIYRLLESLLKSYISSNISIIYITFDQIEPFLTKYEQMSNEILQNNSSESCTFENSHEKFSSAMSIENNIINSGTVLLQPVDVKKEFHINAIVDNGIITTSTLEKNLSRQTDDTSNKIDLSNEEHLLDYLRTSSLVLIFMKHLDETFLITFIRWYVEVLLNSDLPLISSWNKIIEHFWLITSDYERAETILNIPKTNLFLWPTEHNDFDHISIIISSILSLPIALTINYENYSMFIDGMSIVDKHCQETTIDQNICVYMALLRIWSSICNRKITTIITYDDELQYFSEYAQMLLTEFEHKMIGTYTSIHGISLAKIFLQQQNHISYDLIVIGEISQKINQQSDLSDLQTNKLSHPYTFILLDQLTPLTLGVLTGVYQLSIFFENIIRDQ